MQFKSEPENSSLGYAGQGSPDREWNCEREGDVWLLNCKVLNLWHKEIDNLEGTGRSV